MEEVEQTPGEEWSGIIPEPASDEIAEPPIPTEDVEPAPTPSTEVEVTPSSDTPIDLAPPPAPVVISTPIVTPITVEAPEGAAASESPSEPEVIVATPKSEEKSPESYLTVEVPTTATYTVRQNKIASLSLVATGIVVFGVIFIIAITRLIKASNVEAKERANEKSKAGASSKVNPLM